MAARTWGDLLNDVKGAISDGDWPRGERAVEWLRSEAEHQGDPGSLASAAFYAGMFFDAKGELEVAQASFEEAVSWDERAHGPSHSAVADALRSVAIVQAKRKNFDGAAATSRRAATIYTQVALPLVAAECLSSAGNALFRGERFDAAYAAYGEALALSRDRDEPGARAMRCQALTGQAECMRRTKEFVVAFGLAVEATWEGADADARSRLAFANAWMCVAFLARHTQKDEGLAALAYAVARDLTPDGGVKRNAIEALAASPVKEIGRDRIVGYVVASRAPDGLMQLVHPTEGVRIARDASTEARPWKPGDRVTVQRGPQGYVVLGAAEG